MASEARALVGRKVAPLTLFPVGKSGIGYLAGIGPERAGEGANVIIDQGVGALMSWGIAGGLHASVSAGHALLPRAVLGSNLCSDESNAHWRGALAQTLAGKCEFSDGTLIQSDKLVPAPAAKQLLHERSGALAVDMESSTIARRAAAAGLPFLAVRVVADDCENEVPDIVIGLNDAWGRVRPARLARRLALGPHKLRDLLALRRSFARGCARLTDVAQGLDQAWQLYQEGAPAPTSKQ